jgi:hypothetical protein
MSVVAAADGGNKDRECKLRICGRPRHAQYFTLSWPA